MSSKLNPVITPQSKLLKKRVESEGNGGVEINMADEEMAVMLKIVKE